MNKIDQKIGREVKKLIISSDIKQTEIASRLGINKSSLSQMLSGVAPLPITRFNKIMEVIGVSDEKTLEPILQCYAQRMIESNFSLDGQDKVTAAVKAEVEKRLQDPKKGINAYYNNGSSSYGHNIQANDVVLEAMDEEKEKAIRADERQKLLDEILKYDKLDPAIRLEIYNKFKLEV